MDQHDKAKEYFELNKSNFNNSNHQTEAQDMLEDYKNRLGFSGLRRLYK